MANSHKGRKLVFDPKTKSFVEGSASPRLLSDELRKLPGDLVTTEIADEKKVHELDPPHVVETLREEWEVRQGLRPDYTVKQDTVTDPEKHKRYRVAQPGENVPLNQEQIDFVRFRVLRTCVDTALDVVGGGGTPDLSVRHMWFPENNINIYELRPGPAPCDKERPKHLRGFELEVDIFNWPKRIVGILQEGGHPVPDPHRLWKKLVEEAALKRELALWQ